jgi:hypothetical protein
MCPGFNGTDVRTSHEGGSLAFYPRIEKHEDEGQCKFWLPFSLSHIGESTNRTIRKLTKTGNIQQTTHLSQAVHALIAIIIITAVNRPGAFLAAEALSLGGIPLMSVARVHR